MIPQSMEKEKKISMKIYTKNLKRIGQILIMILMIVITIIIITIRMIITMIKKNQTIMIKKTRETYLTGCY